MELDSGYFGSLESRSRKCVMSWMLSRRAGFNILMLAGHCGKDRIICGLDLKGKVGLWDEIGSS